MIYIRLLTSFIKIGAFSFGGGYAMIPLIQKEIERRGWLGMSEFVDIIGIAEMTPGPIAVNSATFVGYKVAGIFGGMIATIGVAMPSLVIIMIVSRYFFKHKDHPLSKTILQGIRPVVCGLIIAAALFVSNTCLFKYNLSREFFIMLTDNPAGVLNLGSIAITLLALIMLLRFKIHPIAVIAVSAFAGVALFG